VRGSSRFFTVLLILGTFFFFNPYDGAGMEHWKFVFIYWCSAFVVLTTGIGFLNKYEDDIGWWVIPMVLSVWGVAFWSYDEYLFSSKALFCGSVLLTYALCAQVYDRRWRTRYINLVLGCSAVTAVYTIIQYLGYDPIFCVRDLQGKCFSSGGRLNAVGIIGNPGFLGIILIPAFLLGAWHGLVLGAVAGMLSMITILVASARTALVGISFLVPFIVPWTVAHWFGSPARIRLCLRIQTVVLMIAISISLFIGMGDLSNSTITKLDQRTSHRIFGWRIAGRIAYDNSVLGIGMGNFRRVSGVYRVAMKQSPEGKAYPESMYSREYWWNYAHNEFLQSLAELGIIGFGLIVVIVFSLAWMFSSIPHTTESYLMTQAWFAMVVTCIGHYTLRFAPTGVILLLVTALTFSYFRDWRKSIITGIDS